MGGVCCSNPRDKIPIKQTFMPEVTFDDDFEVEIDK